MVKNAAGKIIVILGPPGSGKGTQAKVLAQSLNISHVSPGTLLRELALRPYTELTPYLRRELAKMRRGEMVAHKLVYALMFPKIEEALKKKRGIVIDGALRTKMQAAAYLRFFKTHHVLDLVHVLYLTVPVLELMKRIKARKRSDDTPQVIAARFKVQGARAQKPVLAYLRRFVSVSIVSGNGSIKEVQKRMRTIV